MGNKLMSSPGLHFTVHHADTSERATRQVGKSYVPQWYSRENQLHSHGKYTYTETYTLPSSTNFSLLKHSLVSFSNNTSRANANPHITLLSPLRLVNKIMSLFTNSLGAFEPSYIKTGPVQLGKTQR